MKAQSSIEFVVLVGAMLVIFIAFLYVFQTDLAKKGTEARESEFNELAIYLQNELDIAAGASNGYIRTFELPETVRNKEYALTLVDGAIYLQTIDGSLSLSVSAQNVTGQPQTGPNTIRKVNETIYLNQNP